MHEAGSIVALRQRPAPFARPSVVFVVKAAGSKLLRTKRMLIYQVVHQTIPLCLRFRSLLLGVEASSCSFFSARFFGVADSASGCGGGRSCVSHAAE